MGRWHLAFAFVSATFSIAVAERTAEVGVSERVRERESATVFTSSNTANGQSKELYWQSGRTCDCDGTKAQAPQAAQAQAQAQDGGARHASRVSPLSQLQYACVHRICMCMYTFSLGRTCMEQCMCSMYVVSCRAERQGRRMESRERENDKAANNRTRRNETRTRPAYMYSTVHTSRVQSDSNLQYNAFQATRSARQARVRIYARRRARHTRVEYSTVQYM